MFRVMIEGDYACFTRPEFKVERVSYEVPTPGALEGLLKCIYWKPPIRYVIDKIIVFNPISYISVRKNEVKEKLPMSKVLSNVRGAEKDLTIYTSEMRTQRNSLLLRHVKYGVEFHFELTHQKCEREERQADPANKHAEIIRRRLTNGQHFRTPYLGCKDFSVKSIRLTDEFDMSAIAKDIADAGDVDLGFMLYRMEFADKGIPLNNDWEHPVFSDRADPVFYRPHMCGGVIDVAKYKQEGIEACLFAH